MSTEQFQNKLLNWFDLFGRKNLPWQQNISAYNVWLSEIMLQQTQVKTVIPYYERFLNCFPDVHSLAKADLDQVLHLWAGLGYYARARNLYKTANIISNNGGEFPTTLEALSSLPGIGRSTAGAILSIAFNESHPILDGNVRRVITRFFAISGWPGKSEINRQLWKTSSELTPVDRVADYTQAIMDLGATVCKRSKPLCEICPVNVGCKAHLRDEVAQFPTAKEKKVLTAKHVVFLILIDADHQLMMEKKPEQGIWGGLWSFPEFTSIPLLKQWLMNNQFDIVAMREIEQQRHAFSHYHLDYGAVVVKTKYLKNKIMEKDGVVWYRSEEIRRLGVPAPISGLLKTHYFEDK